MGEVERLLNVWGNLNPFHLHKPSATNSYDFSLDRNRDPKANLVLGIVGWRQRTVQFGKALQDRLGNRVSKTILGCGGISQDFFRGMGAASQYLADLGNFAGKRSRLVEQDSIDLVHQVHCTPIFDQNAVLSA